VEETFGMAWRLFATMLERAETTEAVGLNWARLHSTRPTFLGGGVCLTKRSESFNLGAR
jgi:hypothetical protein